MLQRLKLMIVWEWEWEGMGIAQWESHGNGNWLQNWEWEWEGMGIDWMGMGGNGNIKSLSRSSLLQTELGMFVARELLILGHGVFGCVLCSDFSNAWGDAQGGYESEISVGSAGEVLKRGSKSISSLRHGTTATSRYHARRWRVSSMAFLLILLLFVGVVLSNTAFSILVLHFHDILKTIQYSTLQWVIKMLRSCSTAITSQSTVERRKTSES